MDIAKMDMALVNSWRCSNLDCLSFLLRGHLYYPYMNNLTILLCRVFFTFKALISSLFYLEYSLNCNFDLFQTKDSIT